MTLEEHVQQARRQLRRLEIKIYEAPIEIPKKIKKKKRRLKVWLTSLVSIVVLATGGYFGYNPATNLIDNIKENRLITSIENSNPTIGRKESIISTNPRDYKTVRELQMFWINQGNSYLEEFKFKQAQSCYDKVNEVEFDEETWDGMTNGDVLGSANSMLNSATAVGLYIFTDWLLDEGVPKLNSRHEKLAHLASKFEEGNDYESSLYYYKKAYTLNKKQSYKDGIDRTQKKFKEQQDAT